MKKKLTMQNANMLIDLHLLPAEFDYENEVYKELRVNMPDINDIVRLETGEGKVLSVDVLKREVKVKMFEDETFVTAHMDEIKAIKSKKNRNEGNE